MADESSRSRVGILLGAGAVAVWSGTGPLVSLGGRRLDVWQFVTLACAVGGIFQLIVHAARTKQMRSCFVLPLRLWLLVVFGFVFYGLAHPWAITASVDDAQVCGVNLINYLWPVLTVLCAVMWVPGTRLTWALAAAMALSLAGLALANTRLLHLQTGQPTSPWPYVFVAAAAVAWAVYSSVLSRWRDWVSGYATAPVGFLIISAIAAVISLAVGRWRTVGVYECALVLLCGLGPFGTGYMLWELALHRAEASVLAMMSSAIPVLSTAVMCLVWRSWPSPSLIAGAALVALAVILAVPRPRWLRR